MTQIRKAISLIFKNSEGKILTTKRSLNKDSFPGFWSLPSAYLHDDEKPEEAAKRLAKNKLGLRAVEIASKSIGTGISDRDSYRLHMEDYNVLVFKGRPNLNHEEYSEMKWVTVEELKDLIKREQKGQMGECTKILIGTYSLL